jgi:mutual gliding-motility protein MglA
MAYLNVKERVIETKIVYYGAGLSGKTTNLEQIKKLSTEGRCGEMMSLDTDGDRTLFFDWLPFNIGKFNGCDVKMQLYTVPGQQRYSETRKKVLASADGVILVLDSQSGAVDKNRQILADLRDHMAANGLKPENVPIVVQLNKRDLPTAMSVDELMTTVGVMGWPSVEAVAASGQGVFETLREASRLVLQAMREGARTKSHEIHSGTSSGLDGASLYTSLVEAGYAPGSRSPSPLAESAARTVVPPNVSESRAAAEVTPAPRTNGSAPARPTSSAKAALPVPIGLPEGANTQVNELIAGQRGIVRRIDSLEQAVQHGIASSMADIERRLVARIGEAVERQVRGLLDARSAAQEATRIAAAEAQTARDAEFERRVDDIRASMATRDEVTAIRDVVDARLRDVPNKAGLDALQSILEKRIIELRSTQVTIAAIEKVASSASSGISADLGARIEKLGGGLTEQKSTLSAVKDICDVTVGIVRPIEKKFDERSARLDTRLREFIERLGTLYGALDENVKSIEGTLASVAAEQRESKKGWFR